MNRKNLELLLINLGLKININVIFIGPNAFLFSINGFLNRINNINRIISMKKTKIELLVIRFCFFKYACTITIEPSGTRNKTFFLINRLLTDCLDFEYVER